MHTLERTLAPAALILVGGIVLQAAGREAAERLVGGPAPAKSPPARREASGGSAAGSRSAIRADAAAGQDGASGSNDAPGSGDPHRSGDPHGAGDGQAGLGVQLQRVDPAPEQFGSARHEVLSDWRERLIDTDLQRREQSFERLIQAVRRNPSLGGVLREWAVDERHPGLAWTSRLALRELARPASFGLHGHLFGITPVAPGSAPAGEPGSPGGGTPGGGTSGVLERGQGPGAGPGHAATPAEGDPEVALPDPRQVPGGSGVPVIGGNVVEGFSLTQGPHGVVLELRVQRNGQPVSERYQGATMGELLAAHPGLEAYLTDRREGLPHASLSGEVDFWSSPSLDRPEPWSFGPSVRTDVLGVGVHLPTDLELKRAGRSPTAVTPGLMIDRVEAGTIAEYLGLRAGELLVSLNGRGLAAKEDIRRILGERPPKGQVRARVVDAYGRERQYTWLPAPAAAPAPEVGGGR